MSTQKISKNEPFDMICCLEIEGSNLPLHMRNDYPQSQNSGNHFSLKNQSGLSLGILQGPQAKQMGQQADWPQRSSFKLSIESTNMVECVKLGRLVTPHFFLSLEGKADQYQ